MFAGVAGCQGGGPQRYAVSGEVKFQGKPLDQGAVTFGRFAEPTGLCAGKGALPCRGALRSP
jgi:hypothetical protein